MNIKELLEEAYKAGYNRSKAESDLWEENDREARSEGMSCANDAPDYSQIKEFEFQDWYLYYTTVWAGATITYCREDWRVRFIQQYKEEHPGMGTRAEIEAWEKNNDMG
jgi:hypothetical protein